MERTSVAVLGTLAEFHREPIPYDLAALVRLVTELRPDLLCLDLTPEQWQRQEFGDLPPEYVSALLPLAHQTDMVVVPIAGERSTQMPTHSGWRGWAIDVLRQWLAYLQRTAPGPAAVNEGPRHFVADLLYEAIGWLAGAPAQQAWNVHMEHLASNILTVVQRDPGRRVLVAVNVRYCHHLRRALGKYPAVRIVRYTEL